MRTNTEVNIGCTIMYHLPPIQITYNPSPPKLPLKKSSISKQDLAKVKVNIWGGVHNPSFVKLTNQFCNLKEGKLMSPMVNMKASSLKLHKEILHKFVRT